MKRRIFKICCLILLVWCGLSFFAPQFRHSGAYADMPTTEVKLVGGTIDSVNLWTQIISQYKNWSNSYNGSLIPTSYCMRDEYIIYTENQASHGLCWAFTSSTVLSTTIMQATGEYYDFSEGYVATVLNNLSNNTALKASLGLSSVDYYVGGGGNFYYFDLLSQYAGVLLESDFTYEEYHNVVSESTADYYGFLKEKANKTLLDNLQRGQFNASYINLADKETIKNSIKQHIMNNGGLYAGYDWGSEANATYNGNTITYKVPNVYGTNAYRGGHAVTLIGWDDNIEFAGQKGAWIFLNSWGDNSGNDGIYYAAYDDTDLNSIFGYKYVANSTDLYLTTEISESNANYTITNAGAYAGNFDAYENSSETQNIFYKDEVELTYSYRISNGATISCVEVYHFDTPCNVNVLIDQTKQTITISGQDLKTGNYKVYIKYTNGQATEEYLNNFYVLDGMEIEYAQYQFSYGTNYAEDNGGGSIKNNGVYQIFDGKNDKNNQLVFGTSESSTSILLKLYFDHYTSVASVSVASGTTGVMVRDDLTNASNGKYGFQINISSVYGNKRTLTITSTDGTTKNLDIIILKATSSAQKMVSVLYDVNGGVNNENNNKKVLVSSQNAATIYAPTKDGYTFTGWYTDVDLTNALTKSGSNYLLTYAKVKIKTTCTLDDSVQTFFDIYYQTSEYVFLYAGWERLSASVTFHYNNGQQDLVKYIEAGGVIGEPATPTKDGHTFGGWYTDATYTVKYNFTSTVNGNIHVYAYWIINTYRVTFNYNNGSSASTMEIEYGGTITAPVITKTGYTLVGWYTESTFENVWDFATGVVKDDLGLYAKWTLNSPQAVVLSSAAATYQTAESYTLNLSYEHEITSGLSVKVKWYRNETLIQTTNSLSITEKLYSAGMYEYKAILTITHEGQSVQAQSNSVQLVINQRPINISNINYHGNGYFTWDDIDNGYGYNVLLFKTGTANAVYEVGGGIVTNKNANILNGITSAGEYYIVIEKYNATTDLIGSITSNKFNIYSIDYQTYQTNKASDFATKFVDDGYILTSAGVPERENYLFDGWYDGEEKENKIQFPITINQNTTLWANYTLTPITLSELVGVERVYNKDVVSEISVEALHPVLGTFTYKWLKLGENEQVVGTGTSIYVKNVSDFGQYVASVTLTDADGFSVTTGSNIVWVKITPAETEISYSNMQRYYTYNGNEQTIQGGAKVTREDEVVSIEYRNNKFTNVPDGGVLYVLLVAPATENYAEASTTVEIYVNKLQGTISAESYQSFTYSGQEVVPACTINNSEQTIVCSEHLKDVGKYTNVEVKASESQNYLEATTFVTIEIFQASIEIKVFNTTSYWLLGKNELKYEINGEYYGEELNVKLICDVNTSIVGEYTITAQIDNPNYRVYVIEGIYTVSAMPYYIAGALILFVVIMIFVLRSRRKFLIEFDENGGTLVSPIEAKKKPDISGVQPTRVGYKFLGWYLDENLTTPYGGDIKKGQNITLFAGWEKVTIVNPKQTRAMQADEIVKVLKIGKTETPKQGTKAKIEPKQTQEKVTPKEKTEAEIMNELIAKATSASGDKFSADDINKLINNITKK